MSIHLMKNEKVIWKSFPGKKYRTFLFATQFGISIVLSILLWQVGKELDLYDVLGKGIMNFLVFGITVGGLIFALYNQINLLLIQYFITTDRIIIKKGWLNRKLSSVKHEHIHDTKVEQTFAERLISTGHVYIFTANDISVNLDEKSHLNSVTSFRSIDNPFHIHKLLEEAIEENSKQTAQPQNN